MPTPETQAWIRIVCAALDVPEPDTDAVLDLTRDVAHGVARPAAPLTAYLVGWAAGRSGDPDAAAALRIVRALLPEPLPDEP